MPKLVEESEDLPGVRSAIVQHYYWISGIVKTETRDTLLSERPLKYKNAQFFDCGAPFF